MGNAAAVDVELRLKMRDNGVDAGLKAVEQQAEKTATTATTAAEKASTAMERAAERAATATEQAASRQRSSYERLSHARETLGMRSEQAIQREIQQTVAAYNRLKDSGTLSFQEQTRAAEAMRSKVEQLTNEMGKLTAAQKIMAGIKTAAAIGAGVTAAGYVLRDPAKASMAYDERLGLLANTAYAEYGKDGRKLGEVQIRKAVSQAVDAGITKDAAMDALEKLVADNQVGGVAGALALLPFIGKVTTGQGGSGQDVAAMMGGFIGSGYAKDVAGAKRLLGISSAAATAGAFEKNDMAKHLPTLLPLAKGAGLTGEEGFKKLLVLLQQARTTAGSSDEAANNVKNLLNKLKSNDTAIDFKKAGRGDLYKYLMDQRAKGVDPLTAWQNVIDSEIAKNKNLAPAIAKIQNATNKEEQDAAVEALKGMAEGQSMGKFFQDMQAQGALFGMRNKTVGREVDQAIAQLSGSIVDVDYGYMADKAGVKTRIYEERKDLAKIEAMDRATPVLGKLADAASSVLREFPLLSGATITATGAIAAFAAAAGGAALLLNGGKIPGVAGGAIDRAAKAARSPVGKKLLTGAKVGGYAGGAALLGGAALDAVAGEDSAVSRYGSKMMNGAAFGATVGSVVPVLGTGMGAAVGAAGGAIWQGVEDYMRKPAAPAPRLQGTIDVSVTDDRVYVKRNLLKTWDVDATMNTGNQWTGAPR